MAISLIKLEERALRHSLVGSRPDRPDSEEEIPSVPLLGLAKWKERGTPLPLLGLTEWRERETPLPLLGLTK